MIGVLVLMNFTEWIWWSIAGITIAVIWALKYNRALQRLKKPGFWMFFIVITMLTSFLFTKFHTGKNDIYDGLMIGLQMNLRAIVMIMGFSVIGTELSNPVIRNLFVRTSFRQLPLALEIAFDTLPSVISSLPDF